MGQEGPELGAGDLKLDLCKLFSSEPESYGRICLIFCVLLFFKFLRLY